MAGKGERADKQAAGNLNLEFYNVFLIKSVIDKSRYYTKRWNGGT